MPRVSSAPEDAFHFKGTFEEGWGEVTDAKAVVFQYPPNKDTSKQDPPALYCELTIQRLTDGEGAKAPSPPEQVLLKIAGPDKLDGTLSACHPGNYPDGNLDADPVDCGGELGAEGNTLYAVQDGFSLNDKVKYMRFCSSLQEKGFRPAVLKRTYFPDFIGLRAYFKNVTEKSRSAEFSDANLFVVDKVTRFPYERQAGAAAQPATPPKRPAGRPPKAPAAAAAPQTSAPASANGGTELTAEDIATAIITETLAASQKGATLSDIKKLKVTAFLAINKHKPAVAPELKKAVQDQLGDEQWLAAIGEATGTFSLLDTGQVQFA